MGGLPGDPAAITSVDHATFPVNGFLTFKVATSAPTPPNLTELGLPDGIWFTDNHGGTAIIKAPAPYGSGGVYTFAISASYQGNNSTSQTFTATITENPGITSSATATVPVGLPRTSTVTTVGFPVPTVTETGPLPSGLTYDTRTRTLSGTPGPGTSGTYPVTFTAAANSVGPAVSQRFSLIVNQATMTYPTNGQRNVDTTQPFSWSTIPEATGYQLTIGTAPGGADVFNSGPLFAPQASTNLSALPTGPVLYGTLSAPVTGGGATVQPFSFTAAPGMASFTFPLNGAAAVDSSKPFTWSAIPQAQNYILVVGTNRDQSGQLRASLAIPGVIFDTDPPHRSNVVCHPGHEGQRGLHPISSDHIYRPTRNGDLHLSDGRLHVR